MLHTPQKQHTYHMQPHQVLRSPVLCLSFCKSNNLLTTLHASSKPSNHPSPASEDQIYASVTMWLDHRKHGVGYFTWRLSSVPTDSHFCHVKSHCQPSSTSQGHLFKTGKADPEAVLFKTFWASSPLGLGHSSVAKVLALQTHGPTTHLNKE